MDKLKNFKTGTPGLKLEFIIYSISIGLNRGALIILTPFLIATSTIQDFGVYNYVQILLQLFGPVLGLNLYTAISREGGDDYRYGNYIARKAFIPVIAISVFVALCLNYLNVNNYIIWGICLGGIEACHNMILNTLRCMNRHFLYLAFTCLKTIGFIIILYCLKYFFNYTLFVESIIYIQIGWALIIAFFYQYVIIMREAFSFFSLKEAIIFSVTLVPHSLAQWIIAGTGRFFVKNLVGSAELGVYSKAFNLSMVLMVINSGIGLILPQHLIRNYSEWIGSRRRFTFFLWYSLTTIFVFLLILVFLKLDELYFQLFNAENITVLFLLNFLSFYFLGYYYYYSNILFVHRKTRILTFITVAISIITIVINILLITFFGLIGAAVSSLVVYLLYLMLCIYFSVKEERSLKIKKEVILSLSTVTLLVLLTFLYLFLF